MINSTAFAFRCINPRCQAVLGPDHVLMVTTCHQRRFCSVECLTESHRIHLGWLRLQAAIVGDLRDLAVRATVAADRAEAAAIQRLDRSRV
jgi:hypothetical protein